MIIELADILEARERIHPYVYRTPLVRSDRLSALTGGEVHLKLENEQRLRSFKIRGMVNRVLALTPAERRQGIIVASSGNHGIAAAHCGRHWGIPVEIVIPENTPATKLQKMRLFGPEIVIAGKDYDEAMAICAERREGSGRVYVDPASDEMAVAGHGTIGLEILEDRPEVEVILVPVGGGGLVTGISLAAKGARAVAAGRGSAGRGTPAANWTAAAEQDPEVVGVQTAACPAMRVSLDEGVPHERFPSEPSECEGLIGGIGALGWRYAPRCLDDVVVASEAAIRRSVLALIEHEKVVSEASGAVGVAYVVEHPEAFRGRDVVIVVSGGNLRFELIAEELERCS